MKPEAVKKPVLLIVATLDTKWQEAEYLRQCIEGHGCRVIFMDAGILASPGFPADVARIQVAAAGGTELEDLIASQDKGRCILTMIEGVKVETSRLFADGEFQGVIGIGGAQGTDLGTAAMRVLPFGVPKFMVSTVASGRAAFGPYVDTKDIIMMHSVADIQGLNRLTRRVLENAAAAVCGMVLNLEDKSEPARSRGSIALSMLGTTTPGALRAKSILENHGYECIAFHQNGTGGIAMEDMIAEGFFQGVLDINLHEIGDRHVGGLHAAIRDYRLEMAGRMALPQVVAPGSIYYSVQGPVGTLTPEMKQNKYIVHNPNLTLVRLTRDELREVGRITAAKLNRAKGPVHVFIPLQGFAFPDREGLGHWDPEGNQAFIEELKRNLLPSIPLEEIDAHINDDLFIDPLVDRFLEMIQRR